MADNQTAQRDPGEIRREIEQTRANMSRTIDALETKLNPQRLKQEAKESVRRQTVGRVEDLADNASQTVKGASTDVFETIKQNPLPAALVAVGLGWLFMESKNQNRGYQYRPQMETGRYSYRYYDTGNRPEGREWRREPMNRARDMAGDVQDRAGQFKSDVQERTSQFASNVQDRTSQVASDVQDKASEVASNVQDTASRVSYQAREQVGQLADEAQWQASQAKSRFEDVLDENPLLIGAAALALGAAIGMSLPATPQETQLMGEMRDNLMDKAQTAAQETMQKVQQVAERAGDAAKDAAKNEAQQQGLSS